MFPNQGPPPPPPPYAHAIASTSPVHTPTAQGGDLLFPVGGQAVSSPQAPGAALHGGRPPRANPPPLSPHRMAPPTYEETNRTMGLPPPPPYPGIAAAGGVGPSLTIGGAAVGLGAAPPLVVGHPTSVAVHHNSHHPLGGVASGAGSHPLQPPTGGTSGGGNGGPIVVGTYKGSGPTSPHTSNPGTPRTMTPVRFRHDPYSPNSRVVMEMPTVGAAPTSPLKSHAAAAA